MRVCLTHTHTLSLSSAMDRSSCPSDTCTLLPRFDSSLPLFSIRFPPVSCGDHSISSPFFFFFFLFTFALSPWILFPCAHPHTTTVLHYFEDYNNNDNNAYYYYFIIMFLVPRRTDPLSRATLRQLQRHACVAELLLVHRPMISLTDNI